MDSIIDTYVNSGVPLELEYRYKLNKDEFARLYMSKIQDGTPTYTKSISYVMRTKAHSVVKETYYDTDPPRTEFRIKKKLKSVAIGTNKLVLSEERPTAATSINSTSTIIRQKLRASILCGEFSHDFTLVRRWDIADMLNVSKRTAIIDFIKTADLASVFIALIDNPDYTVELELEFKGTVPTRALLESINYRLHTATNHVLGKLHRLIHPAQKHIQPSFGRLINKPNEFNRQTFHKVLDNITAYTICAKTNGMRVLLYIENGMVNVVRANSVSQFPATVTGTFVLDAEEFRGTYYVFDVLYANRLMIHELYTARFNSVPTNIPSVVKKVMVPITCAADVIALYMQLSSAPTTGGKPAPAKPASASAKSAAAKSASAVPPKPAVRRRKGGSAAADLAAVAAATMSADYDGMIFTPIYGDYWSVIYKWKPAELRSSDFLVQHINGRYLLCCSITYKLYADYRLTVLPEIYEANVASMYKDMFPIQFSPMLVSSDPLPAYVWTNPDNIDMHNKVGEFVRTNNTWKLLTVRDDKTAGNSYKVCNENWNATFDPILITDFVAAKKGYFTTSSADHVAQRKYINRVKSALFGRFSADSVVDFGIGKLQDIHKYTSMDAKLVIGIDPDTVALSEAVTRRLETANATFALALYSTTMTDPDIVARLRPFGKIDLVVANLSLHYSAAHLPAFVDICRAVISRRGHVLIVDINAELVDGLPADWEIREDDILKYKIMKDPADATTINVYYPFADKMMTEPKLYFGAVIDYFVAAGFVLASRGNLMSAGFNVDTADLSPGDTAWISLWEYLIFSADDAHTS